MISTEALYDTLNRKPFQPFRVYLKDGRIFDIRYRRNNIVAAGWFVIGIPAPEDPEFLAECTVRVSLDLIDRVEDLSAAAASMTR